MASRHPSLFTPYSDPGGIDPVEQMEPYSPCWCGSGSKWKWCHKGRSEKQREPIGKHLDDLRNAMARHYCSHPQASAGECAKEIIRAHTIPRSGGLTKIAEDGHVHSVKAAGAQVYANKGLLIPKRVGVRSASTFAGFCGKHDAAMFMPIERGHPQLNDETCFLMSFRAIAYELFQKRQALEGIEIQRKLDYGRSFEEQAAIQMHIHYYLKGTERGLQDLGAWKDKYDAAYLNQAYSSFSFFAVQFSDILPVAACGAFHPEISFDGEQLQILSRGNAAFDHVTVTLLPMGQATAVVFGWLGSDAGPTVQFVKSFANLPDDQKANAAVHLVFEHLENTYLRPSWWDGLTGTDRDEALKRFSAGTALRGYFREDSELTRLDAKFVQSDVAGVFSG
jgi:hypothetical protein